MIALPTAGKKGSSYEFHRDSETRVCMRSALTNSIHYNIRGYDRTMSMLVTPEDSPAATPSPQQPLPVEAEAPSTPPPRPPTLRPAASPSIHVMPSPPHTNLASPPLLNPVSSPPMPPNPVLTLPPPRQPSPVTSPPPRLVFSPLPTISSVLSPPPLPLPARPPPATLTPPPPASSPTPLQLPPSPTTSPVLSPPPVTLLAPPPPDALTLLPPISSPSPQPPPETSPPPAVTTPPPLLSGQPPTTSPPNLKSPPLPATSAPPLVTLPPQALAPTPKPPTLQPIVNGSPHVRSGQSYISATLVIASAFGVVVLLLLCWKICICWRSKRRNHLSAIHQRRFPDLAPKDKPCGGLPNGTVVIPVLPTPSAPPLPSNIEDPGYLTYKNGLLHQACGPTLGSSCAAFTYDELVVATNGFSESNLLGEGGFGYVHRGVIPSGKFVAIKQLKEDSHQGDREFRAEVEIISRVHHKHLVSLVGYCIAGSQRLLVYEFVPNNNLEFHLHGNMCPVMEWTTRLKIAIGAAKGLAYLHEDCNPTIIHRDVKAANILLDRNFEAKVSDFGLAKTFSTANTIITHISTRVVGTFGYLAPEYALSGRLTDKSDVYSFGVMLIELITGRPPISVTESEMNQGLVSWARPLLAQALEDGNFDSLVDPRLEYNYNTSELASMIVCATACVQQSSFLRPKMSQVVRTLEGEIPLNDLSATNRLTHSTSFTSWGSDNGLRYNDIREINKELERREHGFSMYSGTTTKYGLNQSVSSTDTN